ncbi:MAG: hypothetical protein ABWY06_17660 [Pseudomonas sp.]|uniref:hypothetical protein n=1 Tax=Pseudomonas sp. TaxID=306 RepID=UPI00339B450F
MNLLPCRFTRNALGLALLLGLSHAQAAALSGSSIKAIPQGAQSHTLQVKLDAQGDWTVVPSSTVKLRIEYAHSWGYQPSKNTNHAFFHVGESKGGPQQAYDQFFQKAQIVSLTSAQMLGKSGIANLEVPFQYLVKDGIPGTNISGYCQFEKESRLKQGKTLNQVLRTGFNVKLTTALHLDGWYTEGGGPDTSRRPSYERYVSDNTAPITIQCLGNPAIADQVAPPKGPQGLVGAFKVESVELSALPYKTSSACPIEIAFKARVKGVGGGEIKYWLEELGGLGAAVQQGSSLVGQPGEPSELVIMQKVSIKPAPVQPPQGLDSLKANTQGSLVQRRFRFHVIAPNKVQSSQVEIELTCTSTLNGGLVGQGFGQKLPPVQPQPKPELGLQAAPVEPQPPKPELQLQAVPVEPQPPKPELHLQAAPVAPQPPKPELHLQAVPVAPQPPKPELNLQAAPPAAPLTLRQMQLRSPSSTPAQPSRLGRP